MDTISTIDRNTIQARFEQFHANNPDVYETLVRLAREAKARNRVVGIGLLWEVMRWELFMTTDGYDPYLLNNNFRSRYARLIVKQEPDLTDMFEFRTLRSA